MKYLYLYIVYFLIIFNNLGYASEKYSIPDDFNGEITRYRMNIYNNDEKENLSNDFGEIAATLLEIGEYFNDKYPDLSVFDNEDFIDNLRPFFPEETDAQLMDRATILKTSIAVYRKGKDAYDYILSSFIAPAPYRIVHSDDDFDHMDEVKFISSPEGYFTKVYNFKKFLTYSTNADERNAIENYKKQKSKQASVFKKIEELLHRFEWRKALLYGTKIKNPIYSEEGISKEVIKKNFKAKIISDRSYVDNNKELLVALFIETDEHHFVLANDLSSQLTKPQVSIDTTKNIASYEVLYPAPYYSQEMDYANKYYGEFILPIKIFIKDTEIPVDINADVVLNICSNSQMCKTEYFPLSLTIKPYGNDLFSNGYSNIIHMVLNQIPQKDNPYIELKKMVVDTENDKQSVRIEFKSKKNIDNFRIYLEEIDGYTKFQKPLISINDDMIYVRFIPYDNQLLNDLTDSAFTVTAVLNERFFYRNNIIATEPSVLEYKTKHLNIIMILAAFWGGLLLNFLSCIFSILYVKIASISIMSPKKRKQLKTIIQPILFGIFCGFSIIVLLLLLVKKLNYPLYPGIQLQYGIYSVFLLYVIALITNAFLFIADTHANKNFLTSTDKSINFFLGIGIAFLSISFTGPFLSSVVGFAFSGTDINMIIIFYSIALGLSLPYFILLYFKNIPDFLSTHKNNINSLYFLPKLILYVSLLWILWIIYEKTNFYCVVKITVLLILFIFLLSVYRKIIGYLDDVLDENIMEKDVRNAKILSFLFTLIFSVLLIILSCNLVKNNSYNASEKYKHTQIDLEKTKELLASNKNILVKITSDWCLTCKINDILVLNKRNEKKWKKLYNLEIIEINYNNNVLKFMEKYNRNDIPFYILYTSFIRDGLVLSEFLTDVDLEKLLKNN